MVFKKTTKKTGLDETLVWTEGASSTVESDENLTVYLKVVGSGSRLPCYHIE